MFNLNSNSISTQSDITEYSKVNNGQSNSDSTPTAKKSSKISRSRPANKRDHPKIKRTAHHTVRKYDDMWRAYQVRQSVRHVSKVSHVSQDTARRAIETGWPSLNLPALSDRWDALRRQAESETSTDLAGRMKEMLTLVDDATRTCSRLLAQLRTVKPEAIIDEEALLRLGPEKSVHVLERLVSTMERIAKLSAFLEGEPTHRGEIHHTVDVRAHVARVQNMSETDLDKLIARAVATQEEELVSDEVRQYATELLSRYEPVSQYILPACVSRETESDQNLSL